jgi:hypothetical protein
MTKNESVTSVVMRNLGLMEIRLVSASCYIGIEENIKGREYEVSSIQAKKIEKGCVISKDDPRNPSQAR